jgi:hypothetical protein
MSLQHLNSTTQAAVDVLFGESNGSTAADPVGAAIASAAEQLRREHAGVDGKRLTAAMQIVLDNGVEMRLDGSAVVRHGENIYSVSHGVCSCPDQQYRGSFCKHQIAVQLHRMAWERLTPKPSAPASANWNVHEAPVSCYIKMHLGGMELSYTMRDTTDSALAARLVQVLPRLNALAEAQENRAQSEEAPAAEAQAPDEGATWCEMHGQWMPQHSNSRGTWNSHIASDDLGEYFCKGRGRSSQPRR